MPPKKAAAARKPRAPKGGHQLAAPIPPGEVFTDSHKKQWVVGKPVGEGGFGVLYQAAEMGKNDYNYVIKVEPHANGPLFCELHFYMRVAKPDMISTWMSSHKMKSLGVPNYIGSGSHERNGQRYRFMVMERFGSDLQKLFEANGKKFGLKTVLQIGIRLVNVLEYIHDHEYVHADIKAANLLLGYTEKTSSQVYLVDYGLALRYSADGRHKEYKEDPRRLHDGTIEFTSCDAHRGVLPSRRGDLEILGYCLIQWLCGRLPWEDKLSNKDYVANSKFKYAKDVNGLMKACFPKGDGQVVLRDFMTYAYNLEYDARPDYSYLRKILTAALKKNGFTDDGKLVFTLEAPKAGRTPKASPVKKSRKRVIVEESEDDEDEEEEDEDFLPSPAKAKRGAGKSSTPARSSRGSKAANGVVSPPRIPIGIRGPPIGTSPSKKTPRKPATPRATPSNVRAKASKGGRVKQVKESSSVATQTSPGLKGLRRSRKT